MKYLMLTVLFMFIILFEHSILAQGVNSSDLDPELVAAQAMMRGDAKRGALLFHKSSAACIKCHGQAENETPLGPDLTTIDPKNTHTEIVESILFPSKQIRKGYETLTVVTDDGKSITGMFVKQTEEKLVLRNASNLTEEIVINRYQIEDTVISKTSMMPEKLVDAFHDENDLYDLVRYVIEIARGGKQRATDLQPSPQKLIVKDDTQNLDHAGILKSLSERDFKTGQRIYQGHCKNCHGADGNQPTLPTARAFGTQPLKFGADPYRMLTTLTNGAGLMASVQHLTPKERYQVIYYIREQFMKPSNPAYQEVDATYLSQLPKGENQGDVAYLGERDYGPVLGSQIGDTVNNALTFRFDNDVTLSYDLHRMRLAGAWQGGFLDLSQTQHYRQRGERMPQIDGELLPGISGWQWAFDNSFDISKGDKPPRGPIRSDWLQYEGHYLYGNRAVLSYGIHEREILETISSDKAGEIVTFKHSLRIGAGNQPLKLCVAELSPGESPSGFISDTTFAFEEQTASNVNRKLALISGQASSKQNRPQMANRHLYLLQADKARELDLGTPGRTVLVRFRTDESGTLIASTPERGEWKPHGKTLFIRGGRLVFDIGWVGAIQSRTNVNDGKWHLAALVVNTDTTFLYVDGKLEAKRDGFRRSPENGHVLKIGATANNFGGDYQGEIEQIRIYDDEYSSKQIASISESKSLPEEKVLFDWQPAENDDESDAPDRNRSTKKNSTQPLFAPQDRLAIAAAGGDVEGMKWEIDSAGRMILLIPPSSESRLIHIVRGSALSELYDSLCKTIKSQSEEEGPDPATMTQGGPVRWPQILTVKGEQGEPINGYALDTIPVPFDNPWNAWLRTSALDFFEDGRAVVTTHGGDVYLVEGLDDRLQKVTWKRFAAGLFEPFGVRIVDGQIYVTCRDGLKRLHDYDGNGEVDFVEAFWIDDDVSSMFHAYNFDLQTDSEGNFYFAKAGQYTRHHRPGTIMKIPPEGGTAEVFAWGLRTPNGMGKLFDDRFTVSDNQGPWMPAGKISLIKPGSFLGNMPINEEQDKWLRAKHGGELPDSFDEPMVWTPQELDNSCGGQIWIDDKRFGPLSGRLLHSSYGKGWLYYMSLQEINGKTQASIVSLPHQWKAGVMRLRVNPRDGQLYGTGLSGWQGPYDGQDGCFQRLRYTGQPARIIDQIRVVPGGLQLTFNFDVDVDSVNDPDHWNCEMWDYLWSKRYGSDQFSVLNPGKIGHDKLRITQVEVLSSSTVQLTIPKLSACDQLSLQMYFRDQQQSRFIEHVYMTIHSLVE